MTPCRRRILRIAALIVAFSGVVSVHAAENDRRPVSVALAPFEAFGQAETGLADSISEELSALLEADSSVVVVSAASSSAQYSIKGSVYSGPERNFVALQLLNTEFDELVLSENYDYTNVPLDLMARDLIAALSVAVRRPTPLLLLATHVNYAWGSTEIGIAVIADGKLWSVDVPKETCSGVACGWLVRGYVARSAADAIVTTTGTLLGQIEASQFERIKDLIASAASGPFETMRHCSNDAGGTQVLAYVPAGHFYEVRLVHQGGDLCIRNESGELQHLLRALDDALAAYDISMPWF